MRQLFRHAAITQMQNYGNIALVQRKNSGQGENPVFRITKKYVPFLYKSNIPSMREISKSGHGITGAYGKPATLMEGG